MFGQQTPMPSSMESVPHRVRAAQDFLYYCNSRELAQPVFESLASAQMPGLTSEEAAAKVQALSVLRMYFAGEMDYGDVPPCSAAEPPDDDPQSPVKQEA